MKALADTNFVVALLDKRDSLHKRALALNARLIEESADLFYADCVINETVSVLVRRLREQRRTADIGGLLDALEKSFPPESLTWTYPSLEEEWASIFALIRKTHGKVNFHDALLAQAATSLEIPHIVSFDANLDELTGWKRFGKPEDIGQSHGASR
jgi:predicted nucleic acid-binding protein